MIHKFKFILPRLAGATVLVGLAAMVLFLLFKLLLAIVVVGGIATLAMRAAQHRRRKMMAYYGYQGINPWNGTQPWFGDRQSISVNPTQRTATIVPIN